MVDSIVKRRNLLAAASIGAIAIASSTVKKADAAFQSNTVVTVNNIAQLKKLVVPALVGAVEVLGYNTPNDGGGGFFIATTVNPGADNGGTIIWSNTAGIYFLRVYDGDVYADWFGADNTGATDSTNAILLAKAAIRKNPVVITNDGLTGKTITVYTSGNVLLNRGIYRITRNQIQVTQDIGFWLIGAGSRGMTNYEHGATTLLISSSGASSATDFGIQFYGNGSRNGRTVNLDFCYEDLTFTGVIFDNVGSPNTFPMDTFIGTYGITGGTRLTTARAGFSICFDEGEKPQRCVFDGLQYAILSDDQRQLCHFTGSISGTTLTVTAVADGAVGIGVTILGSGIAPNTSITALGSGTGGVGTYTVNNSQTIGSESMTADISFGGWDFDAIDCWCYDIVQSSFYHSGNRTRLVFRWRSAVNPININCVHAIDITNVRGVVIEPSMGGSVGNYATSGWFNIINSTGKMHGGRIGDFAAAGTIGGTSSQFSIEGVFVDTTDGFTITGGVFNSGGNRFTGGSSGGTAKAYNFAAASPLAATLRPDTFDNAVQYSYYSSSGGSANNIKIDYDISLDNSTNKFAFSSATNVTINNVGQGQVAISASGSTNLSATNSGKLHIASGSAGQNFILPTPQPGLRFLILKTVAQSLDVNITGSPPSIYTGNGAIRTIVSSSSANVGNYLEFTAIGNTGYYVSAQAGLFTYT